MHDEVVRVRRKGEYSYALESPSCADCDTARMLREEAGVECRAEFAGLVCELRRNVCSSSSRSRRRKRSRRQERV